MFLEKDNLKWEDLDWGSVASVSGPQLNEAKDIVTLKVRLKPGKGHDFHRHPQQEEVIYVLSGEIEQWLDQKKQILKPGDSVFIPANMVHASFNVGQEDATLLAILGPAVGDSGYEVEDVTSQAPWNALR